MKIIQNRDEKGTEIRSIKEEQGKREDSHRLRWLSWPVVKTAFKGLLWIAVVAWLGQGFIVDRYNAFRVSKDRAIATGTISTVQTDVAENDDGSGGPYLVVTYVFVTPTGQRFEGVDNLGYSTTTEVGDSIPIQYLRSDPTVNGIEEADPRGPTLAMIVLVVVICCVISAVGYLCKVTLASMSEAARGANT